MAQSTASSAIISSFYCKLGCLCTFRDARRRQAREELALDPFATAGHFKRWSPTGILCAPSMGAPAFRCDMVDSGSRTLVIILSSRLLNTVLFALLSWVFVFVILLLECRWAVRLLVWAVSVVGGFRGPPFPLPSRPHPPLALQPTSPSDGLTVVEVS